jgi:hypothetical protein
MKYFFAYPGSPASCSEAMRIAAAALEAQGASAKTWQDMFPAGRILIDSITEQIDAADAVVAEISTMSPNVLFEAGYALAKNKHLYFAIDETLTAATRLWNDVGLFATTGRVGYHGNGEDLAKELVATPRPEEDRTLLVSLIAEAGEPQSAAIFAPSVPIRFQAADILDKELANRADIKVLASGEDLGLAQLSYYASEIYRSSGAVLHFMNPDRTHAPVHNARASFLAGFAHGWGRPVLMLAEAEYLPPLDYRDMMYAYPTAAQMVGRLKSWLAGIPLDRTTSRRIDRVKMSLELPVTTFGQYVAENEDRQLEEYFIETSEFSRLLDGEASVYVGRKGTGKTATMLRASDEIGRDKRNLVVRVKPSSYELAGLLELVTRFGVTTGAEYLLTSLWNYLLSTEIAVHALARADDAPAGSGGSARVSDLEHRLETMGVDRSLDLASRLEDTVDRITAAVGEHADERTLRDTVASALAIHGSRDFYRELRALLSGYDRVAVLVDNLDKSWEKGAPFEELSRFLLALLSSAGQVRRHLSKGDGHVNLSLGIFLRTDVYEVMTSYAREPDKIGPLTVQWHDRELLARVLEERYEANRIKKKSSDADMWSAIFPEEVHGLPTRDYILWRILPRPRDMVYFGNAALTTAINRRHSVITRDDINMADDSYSLFAYQALVVESGAQPFDLEEVLFNFPGLGAVITEEDLLDAAGNYDPDVIKTWLLRTSFLGIEVREGKFVHVEGDAEVEKKLRLASRIASRSGHATQYRIHPAFRRYLDVRDDDLHHPDYEDLTLREPVG